MKKSGFEREADLCAAFVEAATKKGDWAAYAETGGFDLLLVRREDGAQIGIEAKLRLNAKVLEQALPEYLSIYCAIQGPDYRAVLVPAGAVSASLPSLCAALGVTVIRFRHGPYPFTPGLPRVLDAFANDAWHEWCPLDRCPVPEYVPDVRAGKAAPVQLSFWKIQAIKLAILLKDRPVTRADFKALGLSPSRWTDPYTGWLDRTPEGYVPGAHMPDFAAMHPRNYAEIEADREKWEPPRPAQQLRLGEGRA